MERAYLDTSFFIGLLENQDNRQDEARKILEYEAANDRFTSELTLNEFLVRVYDDHKHEPDCEERIKSVEISIRSIARVVAISGDVHRESARILSLRGEIHKQVTPPKEPRDRKFRWDAIHLATAKIWKCHRIYAWDGPWAKLPEEIKANLGGEVIAPARCPGLFSALEPPPETPEASATLTPEVAPVPLEEAPSESTALKASEPSGQEPPSGQSPAALPASISPPAPSLPSVPLVAPGPLQPPEAGPPAPPPSAVVPQSPSTEQQTEKPEN
jgi:predicted nucleic acid-binding protein